MSDVFGVSQDRIVPRSKPRRHISDPSRVLLVSLDNVGDLVFASALAPALRERFPNAPLDIWCKAYAADIATLVPGVSRVIASDPFWDRAPGGAKGKLGPFLRALREIRRARYELAVLASSQWRIPAALTLARVPARVGRQRRRNQRWLTHLLPEEDRARPVVAELGRIAHALGATPRAHYQLDPAPLAAGGRHWRRRSALDRSSRCTRSRGIGYVAWARRNGARSATRSSGAARAWCGSDPPTSSPRYAPEDSPRTGISPTRPAMGRSTTPRPSSPSLSLRRPRLLATAHRLRAWHSALGIFAPASRSARSPRLGAVARHRTANTEGITAECDAPRARSAATASITDVSASMTAPPRANPGRARAVDESSWRLIRLEDSRPANHQHHGGLRERGRRVRDARVGAKDDVRRGHERDRVTEPGSDRVCTAVPRDTLCILQFGRRRHHQQRAPRRRGPRRPNGGDHALGRPAAARLPRGDVHQDARPPSQQCATLLRVRALASGRRTAPDASSYRPRSRRTARPSSPTADSGAHQGRGGTGRCR